MFSKVTIKEVQENWEDIKNTVLTFEHPVLNIKRKDFLGNAYASMIEDKLQLWKFTDKDFKVRGILITCIIGDILLDRRKLLILSVYALEHIAEDEWEEAFQIINKFAKEERCEQIVTYTQNPRIIELIKNLKGHTDWVYATWEV
jgi:hypothetical protein